MARANAHSIAWEKVKVFGKEGLFTTLRVDQTTIPEGWHFYEVRHHDNDWCEPIEVGLMVLVNHFGTLITKEPIDDMEPSPVTHNAFRWIESEDDWTYLDECVSL